MRTEPAVSSRLLLAGFGAALALALVLIGVSLLSGRSSSTRATSIVGGAETATLFAGVPQHGNVLGSPRAPLTLVEYADIQCPYCGQWARDTLPTIVAEYVRTGRMRIVFRGLAFVGPESDVALRATLAAGLQGKLWNLLDLLYRNQGAENSGWVDDSLLRGLARAVPGLDVERMLTERTLPSVTVGLDAAARAASAAGVTGTPTFELGPTGGTLRRLELRGLDPVSFREALASRL